MEEVTQAGGYLLHELPPKVMQAHHVGFYVGQVNNGGHGQFISNCGDDFHTITAGARDGLKAMGALAWHQILIEMLALAANSEGACAQKEFNVSVEAAKAFDKQFYAAEEETPIELLCGEWISGWPELRIVDDDQYASAIEAIAALNPFRGQRLAWRNVQSIRYQITDPEQIAVAAACGAVEPDPETKTAVAAYIGLEIEGEQRVARIVWTSKGTRLCVSDHGGARLYEYHDLRQLPKRAGEDFRKYLARCVGSRLSAVDALTIQRFVKVANDTHAAEAIELLLRRVGLNPAATITAWKAFETEAQWIIFTGERVLVARTFPDGAILKSSDDLEIAVATRADIERHAAEVEAAAATMQPPK